MKCKGQHSLEIKSSVFHFFLNLICFKSSVVIQFHRTFMSFDMFGTVQSHISEPFTPKNENCHNNGCWLGCQTHLLKSKIAMTMMMMRMTASTGPITHSISGSSWGCRITPLSFTMKGSENGLAENVLCWKRSETPELLLSHKLQQTRALFEKKKYMRHLYIY